MNVRNGAFISDVDRQIAKFVDFSSRLQKLSFDYRSGDLYCYTPIQDSQKRSSTIYNPVFSKLDHIFPFVSDFVDTLLRPDYGKNTPKNGPYFDSIREILKSSCHNQFEDCQAFISDLDIDQYVDKKRSDRSAAIAAKIKRFGKKSYMNRDKFNYFVTFTRDDKLFSSVDSWKRALLRCFGNLATRYGLQFLGVFERGDLGGRLHFHCFLNLPKGSFDPQLRSVRSHSLKDGRWSTHLQSSYFLKRFGKNEWDDISCCSKSDFSSMFRYMVKYCTKDVVEFYYSRYLPSEYCGWLSFDDVYYDFTDNFCRQKFLVSSLSVLHSDQIMPFRPMPDDLIKKKYLFAS